MADETADVSNKEQLIICIRWVDDCFVIHEDFTGMHPLERTNVDQVAILKNALLRINLNTQRARGQCYNGAATKAGEKTGVSARKNAQHWRTLSMLKLDWPKTPKI